MPPKRRSVSRKTFALLRNEGKIVRSRHFRVRYARGISTGTGVGVVVSSHVAKKAVERNRLKRQLRELMWQESNVLPSATTLVLVVDKNPQKETLENIEREVAELFKEVTSKLS